MEEDIKISNALIGLFCGLCATARTSRVFIASRTDTEFQMHLIAGIYNIN